MREGVDHTPSKRVDPTLHRLDVLAKGLQLKVAMLRAGETMEHSRIRMAGELGIPGESTISLSICLLGV